MEKVGLLVCFVLSNVYLMCYKKTGSKLEDIKTAKETGLEYL
jgi:hypothetical protein